jgi:uncharacterized membrane protein YuzA (DUF378 family)
MATWHDVYKNAALPLCLVGAVNWVPQIFGKPDFVTGFFGDGAMKHAPKAVFAVVGVAALFAIVWTSMINFKKSAAVSDVTIGVWIAMLASLGVILSVYAARKAYD